jgi:cobalamin biosynthesis protein CobT
LKLHSFQELVSRIVHLSTRDGKPIPITFSGTDAYTSPGKVNIPTLPAGTILTPSQFSIWLGYTIHEGPGHQTHTDLNLYQTTCKQRNNKIFSYILNLLEDIRIENADLKKYPGDRKYLDATHHFVDQKIPNHLANSPDIMGLIYKHLFVHHRNLDTNIIRGNLDPETAKLISEIDLCNSTQDCIILADKIAVYLKQKQEEQDQEQNQENKEENKEENTDQNQNQNSDSIDQDQDNNQESKDTKSNSEEQDQDQSNLESDGENENDENNSNSNNNLNSRNSNDLSSNSHNTDKSPDQDNKSDFNLSPNSASDWQKLTEIKNIIDALKYQIENKEIEKDDSDYNLNNKSIFPPNNILNDRIYVPSNEDLQEYNQTRINASSQILSLKKMFRIYLQAQTKKSQLRGLEEGKLDTQRLHIAACGQTTIFKDQNLKLLPETAIELMIDMSGSMNANLARTAAIILAEALSSIPQIKLSISGFTSNDLAGSTIFRRYDPNSGRQCGMDILQFKNFSEPYQKCRAKLGAIYNTGNTPLGDAYGHALEHIIPRLEPRRIIFLITDGQPEFPQGQNHSDYLLMKKIHRDAKRFNIQTLGLGIGRNLEFLSKYFDQAINISNPQELPKNLLEALKRFI